MLSHTEEYPLSFIFGFSKPNISIISSSLDFDKMKRRKNSEIKEPHVEELELISKRKRVAIIKVAEAMNFTLRIGYLFGNFEPCARHMKLSARPIQMSQLRKCRDNDVLTYHETRDLFCRVCCKVLG